MSGPSFGIEDETAEVRLPGVPFPFRVPAGWECSPTEPALAGAVRWVCFDATWAGAGRPPGGVVEVQRCGPPCDSDTWDLLRFAVSPDRGWRRVDVSTLVSEDPQGIGGTSGRARLEMSRVFAARPDGVVDTHVYVELGGPPDGYDDLQKVANDIRANTP